MKNYIIGGLLCVVAALAFGIEPVQRVFNEAANQGTLRGVETCLSYTGSALLSDEVVKATCVNAFQERVYGKDMASGKAAPQMNQASVSWVGVLDNDTADYVTTWIQITVKIFDEEGNEEEFVADTSIWIDPMADAEFTVQLPDLEREQFDNIDWCDLDSEAPKACMSWGITDLMGLSI
ncbi:hypothetical protein [Yoonia algicola]|uniref:Uncharacterized protein n=1 Tax=Yoonia algicola TaxID=3137368 RepID=A0AAN0M7P7_9RHOB